MRPLARCDISLQPTRGPSQPPPLPAATLTDTRRSKNKYSANAQAAEEKPLEACMSRIRKSSATQEAAPEEEEAGREEREASTPQNTLARSSGHHHASVCPPLPLSLRQVSQFPWSQTSSHDLPMTLNVPLEGAPGSHGRLLTPSMPASALGRSDGMALQ